jgi:hypothetical protein
LQPPRQQVDKSTQNSEKKQAKEHDWDYQPDRGNRGPAGRIAVDSECSYASDGCHGNNKYYCQDYWQEDLQPELAAVFCVGIMILGDLNTFFHRFYFSIKTLSDPHPPEFILSLSKEHPPPNPQRKLG